MRWLPCAPGRHWRSSRPARNTRLPGRPRRWRRWRRPCQIGVQDGFDLPLDCPDSVSTFSGAGSSFPATAAPASACGSDSRIGFLDHQSVVLAVTGRVGLSIAGTVPGVLAREREFALRSPTPRLNPLPRLFRAIYRRRVDRARPLSRSGDASANTVLRVPVRLRRLR